MVMGRNGHGPIWLWADLVMGRNDPEPDRNAKANTSTQSEYIVYIICSRT